MSRIKIKNFGPIKKGCGDDGGWIDIKKVTAFIGNQGSGKSTAAKLISTFMWIEKALVRGDYDKNWFERKGIFKNQYLTFHRLENYFDTTGAESATIDYEGDAYAISYGNDVLAITEIVGRPYPLPQIMYVPAERNFVSYVQTPKELRLASDSLKEFLSEFDNAKNGMKGLLKLPVNNVDVEYDKLSDTLNLRDNGFTLKLTEASSGFQSFVPLFLVSGHLANSVKKQSEAGKEPMSSEELERFKKGVEDIWGNHSLTDEQKRAALSVLSSKFNKTAFVNIVEEPEQNLFPSSQWQILQSLLQFNNVNAGNRLLLTTHSPYMVNFLSIAVQANYVNGLIPNSKKNAVELSLKLKSLINTDALVSADDVAIYQFSEKDGSIQRLPSPQGIPSDKNYLNNMLKEGNQLFDSLLEIEEEI